MKIKRLLLPLLASLALPTAVNADTEGVNKWLNEADLAERQGWMNAFCTYTNFAIDESKDKDVSSRLKSEVKYSAKKCNLRY